MNRNGKSRRKRSRQEHSTAFSFDLQDLLKRIMPYQAVGAGDEDESHPFQACAVHARGVRACDEILVFCSDDEGLARYLHTLGAAWPVIFSMDFQGDVLVLGERAKLQAALGENVESAVAVGIRQRRAADEIAVGDGKRAAAS